MKKHTLRRALIGFAAASLCISSIAYSETQIRGKRGDEPQCQKECLKEHSEKMERLNKEFLKKREKLTYQDRVEEELQSYARCLTNCREVLPVK
jgi:hypothetical protein